MFKPVFIALAVVCAGAMLYAPGGATTARASDIDWDWAMGSNPSAKQYRARKRDARRQHKESEPTKVMAYVKREGEKDVAKDDRQYHCVDKVRGLGTQWIGTEGAMDAAKKDWMERVRYDYGESYLDMTNAQDFISRCGRVSIGETLGQVTYRCEILARPCKAQMKETVSNTK
jgi:hypothetical protein